MQRALRLTKYKLQAAGIKVVDWKPYRSEEALEVIVSGALLYWKRVLILPRSQQCSSQTAPERS
jgi:hypothetical protein